MSLGKLKRTLFRTRLTARRIENVRRYMIYGASIQGIPNNKALLAYLHTYSAIVI